MSRPIRIVSLFATAILLVAALGCGKSSTAPMPVTQEMADDLALQFSSNVASQEGGLGAEFGLFSYADPTGPAPNSRLRNTTTTNDTSVTVGNVTWQLSWSFIDAQGVELPGWTVDAVRLVWFSRATGDIEADRWSASLRRSSTFDISGVQLADDRLVVDGAVNDTVQSQFTSLDSTRTRHHYCLGALTLTDVTVLKNQDLNPFPLSGTLDWTVHVQRLRSNNLGDVEATYDSQVTVVFNGTRYPTVTVARAFHYMLDLVTGAVVRLPA